MTSSSSPITAAVALQGHSLFWTPDYLEPSAGVGQLPLVFWLADALRPRAALSLGGSAGVVHLGLCQTAQRLALDCDCHFHLAQPPSEAFMRRSTGEYAAYSRPLGPLEDLDDSSLELICVHVTDTARGAEIDWHRLRSKLTPAGVMMIYGAGVDAPHAPLPRLATAPLEGGSSLWLGQGGRASLLLFAPEVPTALRDLSDLATPQGDATALDAVKALLEHQAQHLELELHRRSLPLLSPDPTAPALPAPQTLEEARAQIALLVESHATDLDSLGDQLARHGDEIAALKGEHQHALGQLQAELARKDTMLETLNQRLGEMQQTDSTPASPPDNTPDSASEPAVRRGLGRLREALYQSR